MPAERIEEPAVGSLPAAFCENFEQCGSARSSRPREDAADYLRECVATHAPGWGCAHQSTKGQILIVVDSSRSAGANLIKQPITAILQKSATPLANCVFVEAELVSHILAGQAVRTSQNDAASLR
jgi:hypothetical protein